MSRIGPAQMEALLRPRSVAVVGASDRPGSFGHRLLENLAALGYPGEVLPVNPRLDAIEGRRCYPSLSALPRTPDCAVLAVSNRHVLGVLEEAARNDVPAAVVFDDPHVGPGRDPGLPARIRELSCRHGMAVCGPNAMGYCNLHDSLAISGYPVDTDRPAGGVALIAHSGTVFDAMMQNDRGVRFSHAISCGSEAAVSAADYLRFLLEDPHTRVIACYLETVRDPGGFAEALGEARRRGMPVVVLKVGRSARGREMTAAHSGALAGSAEAHDALFRRYGACQVGSLDEMMDTLELLDRVPRAPGPRLSVLMESGGERSLFADIAAETGLAFTEFSPETEDALREVLDDGLEPGNPLDAFGLGRDVPGAFCACLEAMDRDPGTGVLVLSVELVPDSNLPPMYVAAALRARPRLEHPLVVVTNLSAASGGAFMRELRGAGIPVLMGTRSALRAIRHLVELNTAVMDAAPCPRGRPDPERLAALRAMVDGTTGPLREHESKRLLAAYGIPIAAEAVVQSATEAQAAARRIGFPVVLKTAAPEVLHKSDGGGVRLGLGDGQSLDDAYAELSDRFGPRVLVQRQVSPGAELMLGMKRAPPFGALVLFGIGGVLVEVYRDVTGALAPFSEAEARAMPARLRGRAVLDGVRGCPPVDTDALVDVLMRFSTLAGDFADLVAEIDVNPLIATGGTLVAVDALVVPGKAE